MLTPQVRAGPSQEYELTRHGDTSHNAKRYYGEWTLINEFRVKFGLPSYTIQYHSHQDLKQGDQ